MNRPPFPYRDFVRVRQIVLAALQQGDESYVLVTGETGAGGLDLTLSTSRRCPRSLAS